MGATHSAMVWKAAQRYFVWFEHSRKALVMVSLFMFVYSTRTCHKNRFYIHGRPCAAFPARRFSYLMFAILLVRDDQSEHNKQWKKRAYPVLLAIGLTEHLLNGYQRITIVFKICNETFQIKAIFNASSPKMYCTALGVTVSVNAVFVWFLFFIWQFYDLTNLTCFNKLFCGNCSSRHALWLSL